MLVCKLCVIPIVLLIIGCNNNQGRTSLELVDDSAPTASITSAKHSNADSDKKVNESYAADSSQLSPPIPKTATLTPETQPAEHEPSLDELLLFFPTKHPRGNWKPHDLVFEDVWITAKDGTRIHGWFCPCENPRAVVLFAHGNAGNLSDRAALMTYFQKQLRLTTLIFDYRGYGRSEGRPTVSGVISDGLAAANFLEKHAGIDKSELVLMGRSLGGAIVVQIAPEIQPRGLIIESTFSSLKQIAKHHYSMLAWLVPRNKLDSKTAIAGYKGHLLQSHGAADQVIPFDLGVELFNAANEPKQFIELENADHNDSPPKSYYKQLSNFLESLPTQRK